MNQGMHASFQMDWVFFHTPESLGGFFTAAHSGSRRLEIHDHACYPYLEPVKVLYFGGWTLQNKAQTSSKTSVGSRLRFGVATCTSFPGWQFPSTLVQGMTPCCRAFWTSPISYCHLPVVFRCSVCEETKTKGTCGEWVTPRKTNVTVENQQFQDVSPRNKGDFPSPC